MTGVQTCALPIYEPVAVASAATIGEQEQEKAPEPTAAGAGDESAPSPQRAISAGGEGGSRSSPQPASGATMSPRQGALGTSTSIGSVCAQNLYKPILAGKKNVGVSLLQFADDSLLLGNWSQQNLKVIKCVLRWFELVSGLKINFGKSSLIGFGIAEEELQEAAAYLNSKISSCPF